MEKYIAMYIDIINNCIDDIDPEILGTYTTEAEALNAVSDDMAILCNGYKQNKQYWPIVKKDGMKVLAIDDYNEKHVTQYYVKVLMA